ncbi:hypothetical protein SNARM312S_04775 [Streptomyces narbonensis]
MSTYSVKYSCTRPPVVNGFVPQPAQAVDAVGRGQAVEHLLLQISRQLGGYVPR